MGQQMNTMVDEFQSSSTEATGILEVVPDYRDLFMLPPQSEEVTELLAALVKASLEFTAVKQSGTSKVPYPRVYSTLDDLNSATSKALAKHGLRVVHQQLPLDRDFWILVTKLWHSESGQWMGVYSPIDPEPPTTSGGFGKRQEWGKESTYIRKFHMADLLNLTPEADTDGEPSSEKTPPGQPARGKATPSQGAAQGKRKQSPAEIKSWAILTELGIDQAAWKKDIYEKYKVKSTTEFEPKVWSKILNALEKYQEFILLICDHWQCVSQELRQFLVYKFGHKIAESYDVLHEALNTENGKMAELYKAFCEWKEMPEEDAESEGEPEVEMDPADEDKNGKA